MILFRCDGTHETGSGHVSRSIALAEAFVDAGCEALFVGHFSPAVRSRLDAADMPWRESLGPSWSLEDAASLANLARERLARGVVIDSYVVDTPYLEAAREGDTPIMIIDDFAALPAYPCSAILNFTSRALDFSYPCDSVACFLGPRWFLGRRSLRRARISAHPPRTTATRVLVTAGANDPVDVVLPFVRALSVSAQELSLRIVVPPTFGFRQALEYVLTKVPGQSKVLSELPDLSAELGAADLCLSSAGLTKYEAAYLGIPAGVLSQNEGQALDAHRFEQLGMTVDLGHAASLDPLHLVPQVDRLVHDAVLRRSLYEHCAKVFTSDPTRDVAEALLDRVFRRP